MPEDAVRVGEATRSALINAGEFLYGTHGIDAVSLSAIVREAGLGNKYAVQYHFRGRDGLLLAILHNRSGLIEQRRGELLVEAGAAGGLEDVPTLVRALFLPVIEQTSADGRFTFARFLLQYLNHPQMAGTVTQDPAARVDQIFTAQVRVLLQRQIAGLDDAMFNWRFAMILRMVVSCAVSYEVAEEGGQPPMDRSRLIDEILAMATAAMAAPVRQAAR